MDGDCWLGKEGWNPGSPATPSQAPAARSRHGSPDRPRVLDTSPITLYLCFTLLFFPPLLLLSHSGDKRYNIFIFIFYQICVKHLIKTLFPHSQGLVELF